MTALWAPVVCCTQTVDGCSESCLYQSCVVHTPSMAALRAFSTSRVLYTDRRWLLWELPLRHVLYTDRWWLLWELSLPVLCCTQTVDDCSKSCLYQLLWEISTCVEHVSWMAVLVSSVANGIKDSPSAATESHGSCRICLCSRLRGNGCRVRTIRVEFKAAYFVTEFLRWEK